MKSKTAQRIKELRKMHHLTQAMLAELINVKTATVSKWEGGFQEPGKDALLKMSRFFNVPVEYLIGSVDIPDFSHNEVLEKFKARNLKDLMALSLAERMELTSQYRAITEAMVPLKLVSPMACAGNGNGYEHMNWEIKGEQYIERKALMGHRWRCNDLKLIDIEGDSMEPRFFNGDRILFAEGEPISSGDVIIVWWDNRLYIRGYLSSDKGQITLKPLNKKYPEISIDSEDPRLFIVGKVIAKVPPLEIVHGIW